MIYVAFPSYGPGENGRPQFASYDLKVIAEYISTKRHPGEWDYEELEVIDASGL